MTTSGSKRGRPPYAEGQPRRVGVNLSIRQDLLEQIDRMAAEQGVTRSALIGELLAKALSQ